MDFDGIFSLDARIRYCALLDDTGRTEKGGMRAGVGSLEPSEEAQKVDLQMAVIRGMMEAAHPYLGKANFIAVSRENVMLLAVPVGERKTVLVSSEPDFPLIRLPDVIKAIRDSYPGPHE